MSALLALLLAVGLMPSGVWAASVPVTSDDVADFTEGDGTAALELLTGGDESLASWDAQEKVLTLAGVNFTSTRAVGVMVPDGSTVVLADGTENRIVSTCDIQNGFYSCGIACGESEREPTNPYRYSFTSDGDLTLTGSGSLYVKGGDGMHSNENEHTIGIGAHRLTILGGDIQAVGGTATSEAMSSGICIFGKMNEQTKAGVFISGGRLEASGVTDGIDVRGDRLATLDISGSAEVHVENGISVNNVKVSGGRLTTEGVYGIAGINLEVSGGNVDINGTAVGIFLQSGDALISGGSVNVANGVLGSCVLMGSDLTMTGGALYCAGAFSSQLMFITGGQMEAAATGEIPAVGLACGLVLGSAPPFVVSPELGAGMRLYYEDASGVYRTGASSGGYRFNFLNYSLDQSEVNYVIPAEILYALYEADGTTLASKVRIAPVEAETVVQQIDELGNTSAVGEVNEVAKLYTDLIPEEQEKVPVKQLEKLDSLVQEKNGLSVTKRLPDGMEVSRLALASGVAQEPSISAAVLTVEDVTDTAQATLAEALLELDISLTVDGQAVQPAVPVVITLPCTEEMKEQDKNETLQVVHLAEDGTREEVPYVLSGDQNTLTFQMASFSRYAVVGAPEPVEALTFLSAYRVQTPKDLTEGCHLIVASYSADGRMKEVRCYSEVQADAIQLLAWRTEPTECRAFLLGAGWGPVGSAACWSLSEASY